MLPWVLGDWITAAGMERRLTAEIPSGLLFDAEARIKVVGCPKRAAFQKPRVSDCTALDVSRR